MKFEFLSRGTPSSLPSSRPSTFNNLLFETSYRETRVFLLLRRAHDRRKIVQLRSFFLTLAMICILFFFFLLLLFFFTLLRERKIYNSSRIVAMCTACFDSCSIRVREFLLLENYQRVLVVEKNFNFTGWGKFERVC